jgi:hypothetical protein
MNSVARKRSPGRRRRGVWLRGRLYQGWRGRLWCPRRRRRQSRSDSDLAVLGAIALESDGVGVQVDVVERQVADLGHASAGVVEQVDERVSRRSTNQATGHPLVNGVPRPRASALPVRTTAHTGAMVAECLIVHAPEDRGPPLVSWATDRAVGGRWVASWCGEPARVGGVRCGSWQAASAGTRLSSAASASGR